MSLNIMFLPSGQSFNLRGSLSPFFILVTIDMDKRLSFRQNNSCVGFSWFV